MTFFFIATASSSHSLHLTDVFTTFSVHFYILSSTELQELVTENSTVTDNSPRWQYLLLALPNDPFI